jgi:hypothetical protein
VEVTEFLVALLCVPIRYNIFLIVWQQILNLAGMAEGQSLSAHQSFSADRFFYVIFFKTAEI